MSRKKKVKNDTILLRISKEEKEKIFKVVQKSSYSSASDLIRAGIEKELNLQMYKDNMDMITKQLSKIIDFKLDGFIKSQRKLNANNVRISAVNTYVMGEMLRQVMGSDFKKLYLEILESARQKANYFVSRKSEDISKEELMNFYDIAGVRRNE